MELNNISISLFPLNCDRNLTLGSVFNSCVGILNIISCNHALPTLHLHHHQQYEIKID